MRSRGWEADFRYKKLIFTRWHLSVRLNDVLESAQLPARVVHLDARLADVQRDDDGYDGRIGLSLVFRASHGEPQHRVHPRVPAAVAALRLVLDDVDVLAQLLPAPHAP